MRLVLLSNGSEQFPTEESLRRDIPLLLADPDTEFLIGERSSSDGCEGFLQQRYRYNLWLGAPEAYIEDLFVAEGARRQGLGRRLVRLAADRATARGCPILSLDTTERNEAALRLYEGEGFSLRSPRSGIRLLVRKWLGPGPAPWESRSG